MAAVEKGFINQGDYNNKVNMKNNRLNSTGMMKTQNMNRSVNNRSF